MDKYAIYLRKSRKDLEAEKLGEGETLARHKKILTELAARKGLYVEKIYQELVSGDTIESRPQIQKLMNDCYAGLYRGIIVVDVDRLSRGNQADMQAIMDCLKYANSRDGVLVVTPTKTYDVSHNADDEEYMEFVLFMSRREYKTIKKRMERGRHQAVVEGNYLTTHRPYGYNILKTRTGRTLIPNEEEAPVVKMIFDWVANHNMPIKKVAKKLTAMGIPTYTGTGEWVGTTVKHIISNPVYKGKVRWNSRMQVKTMVNGKLVTSRPDSTHTDHYMEYDGKHKKYALVSEEIFKSANKRLNPDRTRSAYELKNPLAGILVCKKCGKAMVYKSNKHWAAPRYNHRISQICGLKSIKVTDIKNAIVHGLKLYIEEFEVKVDNLPDVDENTLMHQIEALQKEQKKIEKRLAKLFEAWEDNMIDNNEFVARKEVNNKKIDSIKQQIETLEETIPEKEDYSEKIMFLSDALEALRDDNLAASVQNEYLKRIVERIECSRENDTEFILDMFLRD